MGTHDSPTVLLAIQMAGHPANAIPDADVILAPTRNHTSQGLSSIQDRLIDYPSERLELRQAAATIRVKNPPRLDKYHVTDERGIRQAVQCPKAFVRAMLQDGIISPKGNALRIQHEMPTVVKYGVGLVSDALDIGLLISSLDFNVIRSGINEIKRIM
jgi:hypothetical protein